MSEVCHDVSKEPLSGESLSLRTCNRRDDIDGARFPVLKRPYHQHEGAKRRAHEERVREIEHASFSSAIMCLRGARSHQGCPLSFGALDLALAEGQVAPVQ